MALTDLPGKKQGQYIRLVQDFGQWDEQADQMPAALAALVAEGTALADRAQRLGPEGAQIKTSITATLATLQKAVDAVGAKLDPKTLRPKA